MEELRWSATIGDPSFFGWATVFAYFLAGYLCLRAFMKEKSGPPRPYVASVRALVRVLRKRWPDPPLVARRSALWLLLALLMFGLGVNKQLDFQTLLSDIARIVSRAQGWYEDRRVVQLLFFGLVLVGGIWGAKFLFRLAEGQLQDFRVALLGMVFIVSFVLMRAASFHHMDALLGRHFGGVRFNVIFEMTGIALIGISAFRRLRQSA